MSQVQRVQSANGHVVETDDERIVFVVKSAVPANGSVGYVSGAIVIVRAAAADVSLYINRGTEASATFVALGRSLLLTGGTLTGGLTGTTLTMTGLSALASMTLSGDFTPQFSAASLDGAITQKSGTVYITKGSAAALTIADPTVTTDDGKTLTIISTTAFAHTISNGAGSGFNVGGAATDVGTLGGAKGDNLVITAYQGKWYVVSKVNCTLA